MLEYVSLTESHFGVTMVHATANEYRSTNGCPWCGDGGKSGDGDRFRLFLGGKSGPRVWCRQCGGFKFLDSLEGQAFSDEELSALREKMARRKEAERKKQETALQLMMASTDHLRYYSDLTMEALAYWEGEGINLDSVHKHRLGYCEKCPLAEYSPSYTVPVLRHGVPYNIRHRLEKPNGSGKYRPHMANLPTMLFNSDSLDDKSDFGLVLEGEKKSIVVSQETEIPNVAVMGIGNFMSSWSAKFDNWGRVIVALDPDTDDTKKMINTENRAIEIAKSFGSRGLVATLPVKADDFFAVHGGRRHDFMGFLSMARSV